MSGDEGSAHEDGDADRRADSAGESDLGLDEATEDLDVPAAEGPLTEDPSFDRSVGELDVNPPPEYTIGGLSGQRDPTDSERDEYRRRFGRLRTYFRSRPGEYANYQRILNQARVGKSYDEYLASAAMYAGLASILGLVVGLGLAVVFTRSGLFGSVRDIVGLGGVAVFLSNYRVLFGSLVVVLIGGLSFALTTWLVARYYPRSQVVTRTQKIDTTLPHVIVYMYALSHGGASLSSVIRSVAGAESTYGETALEFDSIVRDLDVFGNDLTTAIENSRNLTPSDNLEQFLDDLLSVLESGGQVTPFLEDEARGYLEEAVDAQEDFLETLSILSEVFIVSFVAAPLFLVVILVVISLVGGQTITQLSALVYLVMPIGMAAFLVLVDTLSEPFTQQGTVPAPERLDDVAGSEFDPEDERFAEYRRTRRLDRLRSLARNPLGPVRSRPLYVLALSVPAAVGVAAFAVAAGIATPSVDAMVSNPFENTLWLVVVPLVVAMTPLSYYYERRTRIQSSLARRLPDTLNILSSANKMGIGLTEGLGLVVRSTSGVVANELRKVRNDILWNHSTSDALLGFGARTRVPQLARTSRLLAEGLESTGDLSRVLSIAAEDSRARYKLARARTREMSSYIAIVVIGYLVYLVVVLMLDANYLTPIAEAAEQQAEYGGGIQSPLTFTDVPVDTYRALFFHSAVIQGFGSGLLAGKLADNRLLTGLKFGLALVIVATIAFAFI